MNVRSMINKTATATAFAATLVFASACAHHNATSADNDFGHVAQNEPATAATTANSTTPIPGPAKVDSTGNVYTSSAAPGTGNSSNIGTNTNVNVVPGKASGSTAVTYSEQANLNTAPAVVETTTPSVTETTTQTTAPEPMISSVQTPPDTSTTTTTTETTSTETPAPKHHRRMRKD